MAGFGYRNVVSTPTRFIHFFIRRLYTFFIARPVMLCKLLTVITSAYPFPHCNLTVIQCGHSPYPVETQYKYKSTDN